jgi:drug/metabolite transporter (DMT)-like permease
VTILGASDFSISMIHFWGDVICFVAMLMFACYLVLGRRTRQYPSIWIYLVPLYAFAGVVCMLAVPIAGEKPIWPTTPKEILLVLGLGLVPTVLGHSILNYSMKHLRGQIVSIMNMGQFIFAGVMAYFLRNEIPHWPYYIASLMIVSGSLLALLQRAEKKDEQVIEQVAAATAET